MSFLNQLPTSVAVGPHFYNLSDVVDVERRQPLRILMLADDRHVANVVTDHINGFLRHSKHEIIIKNPIHEPAPSLVWLLQFDAVLIHYSIYVLGEYFLPQDWCARVEIFPGLKAQIVQDEHRQVNAMKKKMAALGVSAVFSSLEVATARKVYAGKECRNIHFFSCLPGYIADSFFSLSPPSIAARSVDVVYRGRTLPAYLGRHAQDKKHIGDQVLEAATALGLKVDISSIEDQRIYGADWLKFIMSGRATLGVEGGASIFDFDGSITESVNNYMLECPGATFEDVWSKFLSKYEGNIEHKTITPRIFEAIACKTALILYPGEYRSLLEPGRHYLELARDGSNLVELLKMLDDDDLVQKIVDCAYEEILFDKSLHKKFYVNKIDSVINNLFLGVPFSINSRWQKVKRVSAIFFSEHERRIKNNIKQRLGWN